MLLGKAVSESHCNAREQQESNAGQAMPVSEPLTPSSVLPAAFDLGLDSSTCTVAKIVHKAVKSAHSCDSLA